MTPAEIKALRKATHFSLDEFAELLGCSLGAVKQWERGDRSPRGKFLNRLYKLKHCKGDCRCFCHVGFVRTFKWAAWTPAEEALLREMVEQGATIGKIREALHTGFDIARSVEALRLKIHSLGLFYIPEKEGLTTAEAAQHLGVVEQTVRKWITRGRVPAARRISAEGTVTKAWRISMDEIHRLQRDMVGLS